MKRSVREVSDHIGTYTGEDRRRLAFWLNKLDYKPGWQFEIKDYPSKGCLALKIKMLVHDTMESRDLKPIVVVTEYTIPDDLLGDSFSVDSYTDWLRCTIQLVEMHEANEWFRFDGVQCFNPHGDPQHLGRRPAGWEWFGPPEIMVSPTLKEKTDE